MTSNTTGVSWEEVIKAAIERSLDGLHTSIPANVKSYLPALQQCVVEPVIEGMPELSDVPVAWPRGNGNAMHLGLASGDSVLLVFCEQDFGPWRLAGSPQAPAILRRHGLFAYAIPGAATDLAPLLSPALLTGAYFGQDGPGGNVVHCSASGVDLGVGPVFAQPVALAALVQAAGPVLLAALQSAAAAAAAAATPSDGGKVAFGAFASSLATSLASWPGPVASAVVKCSG